MKPKPYGIIYLLIDATCDKEYVGQTTRKFKARFNQHKKGDQYIDRIIKKRGEDLIATAILKVCYSKEELDYWEKYFIKSRNTLSPNGYNLTEGGEGGIPCDEIRAKLSVAGKGRKKSPEHRAKIGAGNRGKKQTHEAKEKLSVAQRTDSPYKNLICEMGKKNFLYKELAKLLGLCHQTVSLKMRGKQNFTEEQVSKLVEFFNLPAEYLLERDDRLPATVPETERHIKISTTIRQDSLYKNLLSEMDKHQITYTTLAKLLGFKSNVSITQKMHGKQNFTAKDIAKLVEIFDKPAEYLLERDDGKEISRSKVNRTPFKNLIYEMDERKIYYKELAELLGLARTSVSNKMRDKTGFTAEQVAKLVEIFDKPAEYLLERDDVES